MITADELLQASKPLRKRTAAESKRALEALGLDEDQQKQCIRCLHWKTLDEFSPAGTRNGIQAHSSYCKPCKRVRETLTGMDHKDCRHCGRSLPADQFRIETKTQLINGELKTYTMTRRKCRKCESEERQHRK